MFDYSVEEAASAWLIFQRILMPTFASDHPPSVRNPEPTSSIVNLDLLECSSCEEVLLQTNQMQERCHKDTGDHFENMSSPDLRSILDTPTFCDVEKHDDVSPSDQNSEVSEDLSCDMLTDSSPETSIVLDQVGMVEASSLTRCLTRSTNESLYERQVLVRETIVGTMLLVSLAMADRRMILAALSHVFIFEILSLEGFHALGSCLGLHLLTRKCRVFCVKWIDTQAVGLDYTNHWLIAIGIFGLLTIWVFLHGIVSEQNNAPLPLYNERFQEMLR
ncbi:hypothetical protein VKT23_020686 [Stygiomarasmius scandens]|uniref:Uncharacterized protein n=1 Tax=Marasmiellus scandens TaxID=2682957 RepID=A0ABR1IIJ7_9AGAR